MSPSVCLPLTTRRRDDALAPHPLAQGADQTRILAHALDEDGARTLQRGLDVAMPLAASTYFGGFRHRIERRIGDERIGQRLQARLARGLRLGAPLRLVGRIQVFQLDLGSGRGNGRAELRRQLALLLDAGQHRLAALLQLLQIAEPLLQLAQLRVIEPAGPLLAIARDERHGRALGQQFDHGRHLARRRRARPRSAD